MPPTVERPPLTEAQVIAEGGWHTRYARVLAIASDGNYGFALVDGNGDGTELEEELWERKGGSWVSGSSTGGGPLDRVGSLRIWWPTDDVCFAWGSAPGRHFVTLSLAGERYDVPVSTYGVWALARALEGLRTRGNPVLIAEQS